MDTISVKDQSLVAYLSGLPGRNAFDASVAERLIVEGRVSVNGDIVTNPAFQLPFDKGFIVQVNTKEL